MLAMVFSPRPGTLMRSALEPLLRVLSIDFFCEDDRLEADFLMAAIVLAFATVVPLGLVLELVEELLLLLLVFGAVFELVLDLLVVLFLLAVLDSVLGFVFDVVFLVSSAACKDAREIDDTVRAVSNLMRLMCEWML